MPFDPVDEAAVRQALSGARFPRYDDRTTRFALAACRDLNARVTIASFILFTEALHTPAARQPGWSPRDPLAQRLVAMWPEWLKAFTEIADTEFDDFAA